VRDLSARGCGRSLWCSSAGDILRWVIPKAGKFPKNVRFGLGARLESAYFDVLEELIFAPRS
jgi:hypothetical protein